MVNTNRDIAIKKSRKKSEQAFRKFVDFMYDRPELMQEFPKKIIFHDDTVKVEFAK